ncbi:MAG: LamG-like jellyroll fold domain-containing protein [Salibacteraceae bacterium]
MIKSIVATLLFSLSLLTISAQNKDEFFKCIPLIDNTTPEWAKEMYSKNPNVPRVEKLFRAYYKTKPFVKNLHTQNHKYWLRKVEPLLNEKGFIVLKSQAQEDLEFQQLKSSYSVAPPSTPGASTGWVALGPFETYKANTTKAISWHKNVYAIDQSLSNSSMLICGTEGGGVYKTVNKGADWSLISKGEVFSGGNSAVKIHPTNSNRYLVASNSRIYQSNDGGQTWQDKHYTGGTGNEFQYSPSDTNTIFHTSTAGLYKSINGGITWTQVYSQACWDIDFHPTNSSIAYLLKSNSTAKKSEFYKSINGGLTWALVTNGWYSPAILSQASENGGKIAVTPAAPDLVYVCLIGASKQNDDGWIGIYKSSNTGNIWTNPSGQDGGPYSSINDTLEWNVAAYNGGYHQGFFNFDMEASAQDSNKIWVASIRLSESNDGGKTFKSIGAANSTRLDDFHADVQDIEVIGSDIWVATDGGINYSNDTLNAHVALNRGIQAADFWGFNTGWNDDTYTGGKYHDGTTGWYEGYANGKAYNIGGVEEASGYVHPIESRKMIFRTHYASSNSRVRTIPKTFGGNIINSNDFKIRPNEHYWTAERSGFYFDPRYADHIYVALNNAVFKTTDGGATFDTIFTFPDAAGMVYEMEISRSNPNVLYAVYNPKGGYWDPCEIWKSTNGGKAWTKTTAPTGNNRRFRISIQPDDANKVWVCVPRGTNGQKVFYSANGGSTWINKSSSVLNNENLTDIYYQSGANDMVYVTSQNGVFNWDKNSSNWVAYSTGLPLVAKTLQINPFYRDGELRLASAGRGIWARKMKDTSFAPVAQPITYADSVYCSRDTVFFDCYSILKHQGASWAWNISPAPAFISDTTARNPFVVFGSAGSYDVTLSVTDGAGQTNSKTINDMVTVLNHCTPDTIPGLALDCKTSSGYASIPDLNLSQVDSFTVSAWIMPRSLQGNWAAILIDDNSSAGLNFYHSSWNNNLGIGYHWPGGSWSWSSGLTVDSLVWSHVAMVVKPNGITIYVNGVGSTHVRNLSKTDITSMKIGSYRGWGSRNFNGLIDEVCIWNRALSQEEIRDIKHLTRTGTQANTNNLVAYYQFNLPEQSIVMDKVGINHGRLNGASSKEHSTAPVGGGNSDRVFINSSNNFVLPNTESEIQFGTTTPNNEIVLTRINIAPDSLKTNNPHSDSYWVLNNYGTKNFSPVATIKLKPKAGVPFGASQKARLEIRGQNEHLNNWISSCWVNSTANSKFHFNSSCSIRNSHQLFIQSADTSVVVGNYIRKQVSLNACKKDSVFLEGNYRFVSGVYLDTFNISQTSDSITTTLLTIIKDTAVTDVKTSCDSLLWIDGNTYFSDNSTATYLLPNSVGCDSLITLNLTISNDHLIDSITSCTPITWIDGKTYSANNDSAEAVFINSLGCDSVITLNLNISQDHFIDSITSCAPIIWIDGNTYSQNNDTSEVVYTNSKGCDSIISLSLIIKTIDNSVTQNGDSLKANQSGANYQWLDCDASYKELNGDTNQIFRATKNGRYAVKLESDGCQDTSICFVIENVGIQTNSVFKDLILYPNPTSGQVSIKLSSVASRLEVKQWNVLGELVNSNVLNNTQEFNFEIQGAAGSYLLELDSGNGDIIKLRVIKK